MCISCVARHFNAGGSNFAGPKEYIASDNSSESYAGMTNTAWVKRDYNMGTRNGIMGRMFGATNGWMLFADENSCLNFYAFTSISGATLITSLPVDLTDWTFVASTYDGSTVRLYVGDTGENLTQIASGAMSGGFSELGVRPILFGNVFAGDEFSLGPVIGWNGYASCQFGVWFQALTLDELRQAMVGTRVQPAQIKFICDVNGLDPELGVSISLAVASFSVEGTEVVMIPNVGCDYVPSERIWLLEQDFISSSGSLPPPSGGGGSDDDDDSLTQAQICVDTI